MKIKKYEGVSEQEVMEKIKDELGPDALVLNIKKVKPRGIFKFFKKTVVEISAAYDDNIDKTYRKGGASVLRPIGKETEGADFLEMLAKKSDEAGWLRSEKKPPDDGFKAETKTVPAGLKTPESSAGKQRERPVFKQKNTAGSENGAKFPNKLIQQVYDMLISQDVLPEIANEMFGDFAEAEEDDGITIDLIVKIVYNTIIDILGEPEIIDLSKITYGRPAVVALVGSTGVGKTTTIAKLAADFILKREIRVSLITADTYRIAAVEQLKTYADILDVEIGVVYNPEDVGIYLDLFAPVSDLILVDTAGRSHKNKETMSEIAELLNLVPDCQKYLALSLSTKYEDMLSISEAYSKFGDFSIIFTKLDETIRYGSILNVCYTTGRKISYVTTGQNVPDDLLVLSPDIVAKALLGLGETINGSS